MEVGDENTWFTECLRFFYDAAVFLYSDIERNDTKNFREKKILRVALSGSGVY